jgi:outer membrane protein OmpA-like peptidoglycan-associated protein
MGQPALYRFLSTVAAISATDASLAMSPVPTPIVFFDEGSARLNKEASDILDVTFPRAHPPAFDRICIIDNTDLSEARFTPDLSVRRALAVADALVKRGYIGGAFELAGVGASRPLTMGQSDAKSIRANRYVMVTAPCSAWGLERQP